MEKHRVCRVQYYLQFQASFGGFGTYPLWIRMVGCVWGGRLLYFQLIDSNFWYSHLLFSLIFHFPEVCNNYLQYLGGLLVH